MWMCTNVRSLCKGLFVDVYKCEIVVYRGVHAACVYLHLTFGEIQYVHVVVYNLCIH